MPRYPKHQPPPGFFVTEIDGHFIAGEILVDADGVILDLLPFKQMEDDTGYRPVILFTRNDDAVRACAAARDVQHRARHEKPSARPSAG